MNIFQKLQQLNAIFILFIVIFSCSNNSNKKLSPEVKKEMEISYISNSTDKTQLESYYMDHYYFKVLNRSDEIVMAALKNKHFPINKDLLMETPLFMEIEKGDFKFVKAILKHPNINVNLHNSRNGFTPLISTIFNKQYVMIEILLNHNNIDPNLMEIEVATSGFPVEGPLHFAAFYGDTKALELLLNHPDIDPNLKSKSSEQTSIQNNRSSLSIAAIEGHIDAVIVLLNDERVERIVQANWSRNLEFDQKNKNIIMEIEKLFEKYGVVEE